MYMYAYIPFPCGTFDFLNIFCQNYHKDTRCKYNKRDHSSIKNLKILTYVQ